MIDCFVSIFRDENCAELSPDDDKELKSECSGCMGTAAVCFDVQPSMVFKHCGILCAAILQV